MAGGFAPFGNLSFTMGVGLLERIDLRGIPCGRRASDGESDVTMQTLNRAGRTTAAILGAVLFLGTSALAGNYAAQGPGYTPDLLPPSSAPGECWARVKIPATYSTATQTVMTHAPYETLHATQAELRPRQESVMIKEESVRFEVRQPTFRTVSEKILTRPAYEKLSVVPPRFSDVTETLTLSTPRLVWKKGNPAELIRQGYTIHSTADAGAHGQGYRSTTQYGATGGERCGPTCEIWCLVEEPGVKKSFSRRVMSQPAEVRRTAVPAQYQTVSKQVVADPGGVREVRVPAQFRSITVHDLVSRGGVSSTQVPPQYGNVEGKVMAEGERYEWRRVVCQPATMRSHGHSQGYSKGHSGSHAGGYSGSYSGYHSGGMHGGHRHGADHHGAHPHSGSVHDTHRHSGGEHGSHGRGGGASYAPVPQPSYGSEPLAGGPAHGSDSTYGHSKGYTR